MLARLPQRLGALADLILSSKVCSGDAACFMAAPIDRIERAPINAGLYWH